MEHSGDIKMVASFDQTRILGGNNNPKTLTIGNDYIEQ